MHYAAIGYESGREDLQSLEREEARRVDLSPALRGLEGRPATAFGTGVAFGTRVAFDGMGPRIRPCNHYRCVD